MSKQSYLNVMVVNEYQINDESRKEFLVVGAAFPHKEGDGFNIQIKQGLSLSGDLVVLPPRPKESKSEKSD